MHDKEIFEDCSAAQLLITRHWRGFIIATAGQGRWQRFIKSSTLIRCESEMEPVVGIIIYSMPACSVQLRNIATEGLFTKLGSSSVNMQLINQNIRTIARVVIEPRYRALGLAYELVEKTMPLLNMPYIEALAVMGKVNPFFEKAGMMKFEGTEPVRSVKLRQALSTIGIEQTDLVDIERTHNKIQNLK